MWKFSSNSSAERHPEVTRNIENPILGKIKLFALLESLIMAKKPKETHRVHKTFFFREKKIKKEVGRYPLTDQMDFFEKVSCESLRK